MILLFSFDLFNSSGRRSQTTPSSYDYLCSLANQGCTMQGHHGSEEEDQALQTNGLLLDCVPFSPKKRPISISMIRVLINQQHQFGKQRDCLECLMSCRHFGQKEMYHFTVNLDKKGTKKSQARGNIKENSSPCPYMSMMHFILLFISFTQLLQLFWMIIYYAFFP